MGCVVYGMGLRFGGWSDVRVSGLGRRCRFLLRLLTFWGDMVVGPKLVGLRAVGVEGVMLVTDVG